MEDHARDIAHTGGQEQPIRTERPMTEQRPIRLFFSAGEPSGDQHAAELIRALRQRSPSIEITGYGGPHMEKAGCRLQEDLTRRAIMWFRRAFWGIRFYVGLYRRAVEQFRTERPDGVVLIDYPGFNWWMAKAASREGIPVFYFVPPQIWAWASWRARKMRRYVDWVLCCLPFERPWFEQQQCRAVYVGHPFFDEAERQTVDTEFLASLTAGSKHGTENPPVAKEAVPNGQSGNAPLVVILPGSRDQEVASNIGDFLNTVEKVRRRVPGCRFAVAAFNALQAELVRRRAEARHLPLEVYSERTGELIRAATCCLSVSGSVSLELLYHACPAVILYRISRPAFWVQQRFRRVKYITLVNLLAAGDLYPDDLRLYEADRADCSEAVFPEYLTYRDRSDDMARHIVTWLTDPAAYRATVERLEALKARLDWHGAADRAAAHVLRHAAAPREPAAPAPHFERAPCGEVAAATGETRSEQQEKQQP